MDSMHQGNGLGLVLVGFTGAQNAQARFDRSQKLGLFVLGHELQIGIGSVL
jgi:hypothetical protein